MRTLFWPAVDDEQSAQIVAHRASRWIFAWSILCVAIGLFDFFIIVTLPPNPGGASGATEFVWYVLGAGLIFGVIAWRITKMSFAWSIAGLSISLLGAIAILPSPFGVFIYAVLILIFANAIHATFRYRRIVRKRQ